MTTPSTAEDRTLAQQAMNLWNQGQQDPALNLLRPQAQSGYQWARVMMVWFLHQRGPAGWSEAIPYATEAASNGFPWAAGWLAAQMMNDVNFRVQALALLKDVSPYPGVPMDPMGWAQNMMNQGDPTGGTELLELTWPASWLNDDRWHQLVQLAHTTSERASVVAAELDEKLRVINDSASSALGRIEQDSSRVKSKTQKLEELLERITNAQMQSFYDAESKAAKREATITWFVGLGVVLVAAAIAVLPLTLHYLGKGANLSSSQLLTAHLAPTAAFAGLAGVLLSRSRTRDRIQQKHKTLSIALGTVIVYADQIEDPEERHKFQHDLARAVIEASIQADGTAAGSDETSGVLSLLSGGRRS